LKPYRKFSQGPHYIFVRLRLICDTVASLDVRHSAMLRELKVVEQAYQARRKSGFVSELVPELVGFSSQFAEPLVR
jgi:hypothetical protein